MVKDNAVLCPIDADLYIYNKMILLHTDAFFALPELVLSIGQYVLDSVLLGIASVHVFFHGLIDI